MSDFDRVFEGITTKQLVDAAERAVLRMCDGDRRWQMTVPVQWDDSDTCIMECLRRLKHAEEKGP